jgi:hypothetical protein
MMITQTPIFLRALGAPDPSPAPGRNLLGAPDPSPAPGRNLQGETMRWGKKKPFEATPQINMDALSHDVRNAVLGLQLQRKLALQCISQACKAFLAMDEHFTRIEKALVNQRSKIGE